MRVVLHDRKGVDVIMPRYALITKGRIVQVVAAKNKRSLFRRLSPISRKAIRKGVIKVRRL